MGFLAARSVHRHVSGALVGAGIGQDQGGRLAAVL
jgi:hypothetical protein